MADQINVFWYRRDLRVNDNRGLQLALQKGNVLPIFIFDQQILNELDKDDARVTFIYEELKKLQEVFKQKGGSLCVLYGKPLEIWESLCEQYNIASVTFNKDYEPYAIDRDQKVKELLEKSGIEVNSLKDQVVFEESEIVKDDGKPYTVYTPFKNKWLSKFEDKLTKPFDSEQSLNGLLKKTFEFPSLAEIGFVESKIKVAPFTFEGLSKYQENRDFPAKNQTSHLSPHLRFGTISVREAVRKARDINETFLSELIWREFFMQILYHFPHVVKKSFKPQYDQIKWRNDEAEFKKWCEGNTGYPMVDAGMRELNATGIMHNRVRMVTASFLCKHLLIDWRWGEAYFAKKLLDYDLSANNGNWQWAAGTGCDAAPYFRIFNPMEQLKKFDEKLNYVKKWVPEYAEFDYPKPVVEHTFARNRCLETYKAALQ